MNTLFQVLTLSWSIQGGMIDDLSMSKAMEGVTSEPTIFSVDYGFELSYPVFSNEKSDPDGIYIGISMANWFVPYKTAGTFSPIQDTYTISAGMRFHELTVGLDHACTHSVENMTDNKVVTQYLFGAYNRIFVKLAGKI